MSGADFKAARKAIGMTQATLAVKLGVTPKTISLWENDKNGAHGVPPMAEMSMEHLKAAHAQELRGGR